MRRNAECGVRNAESTHQEHLAMWPVMRPQNKFVNARYKGESKCFRTKDSAFRIPHSTLLRPFRIPHSALGLTFVEILATIAFMALVLPSVMGGISLSLSAGGAARQESQAAALGHAKLMELVATGQLQDARLTGDFGTEWPDGRWTAQVSDFDTSLRQVELTVRWQHAQHERTITMDTLVYTGGGGK